MDNPNDRNPNPDEVIVLARLIVDQHGDFNTRIAANGPAIGQLLTQATLTASNECLVHLLALSTQLRDPLQLRRRVLANTLLDFVNGGGDVDVAIEALEDLIDHKIHTSKRLETLLEEAAKDGPDV